MISQEKLLKENDWSSLIIMDACRFDFFQEIIGSAKKVYSDACITGEWYRHHWTDRSYNNILLVLSNPELYVTNINKNIDFFKIKNTWKDDEWLNPETTLKLGSEMHKKFPGKQIIYHLIPPHLPYIHKEGKQFLKEMNVFDSGEQVLVGPQDVYNAVEEYGQRNGFEKLKHYYKKNIKKSWKMIKNNIDLLNKPIIITSDHGELVGEWGLYHHGINHPLLTKVPWVELN